MFLETGAGVQISLPAPFIFLVNEYVVMTDENTQILKELREIRADIDYIKKHVVDADIILTSNDLESLEDAEKDFKQGKTRKLV